MIDARWPITQFLLLSTLAVAGRAATPPGLGVEEPLAISNMERLNTPADEDDPCLAADGTRFFFTCNKAGKSEIWLAERPKPKLPFANPKAVEELNSLGEANSPLPLPREADGSDYIYFAGKAGEKNFDIFFTRRLTAKEPYMTVGIAPILGLSTPEDELHPWLLQTGKNSFELYFSRKTFTGWRVGVARSDRPRTFEEHKVEMLDLGRGFHHPCVTKDGLMMFLQGPLENKRSGLFVSKRAARTSAWGKPASLDGLNDPAAPTGDRSPSLSPDGQFFYFASDRAGGKGGMDLYVVPFADLKRTLR